MNPDVFSIARLPRIEFGPGVINRVPEIVTRYGRRVMIVTGPLDFTALAHPCARGISASLHVIAKLAALAPKPRVNLTRFDEEHPCSSPCRQPSVVQIQS